MSVRLKISMPRAHETRRAFLGVSQVQETILTQLYMLDPNYRWDYGVRAILTLKEEGNIQ